MELLKFYFKKVIAPVLVMSVTFGVLAVAVNFSYFVSDELAFVVIVVGVILAFIVQDIFSEGLRRQRQSPTELPRPSDNQGEKHPSKEAKSDK